MVTTRRNNNQVQQAAQALLSLSNSGNRRNQGASAGRSNNIPAGSRRTSTWFDELMRFNANKNNFCIPRRGTPDYNKIMTEVRKQARASAPSAGASSSGQAGNSRRASAPPAGASSSGRAGNSRRASAPPVPAGPSQSGASRPVRQRNPVDRYKNRN